MIHRSNRYKKAASNPNYRKVSSRCGCVRCVAAETKISGASRGDRKCWEIILIRSAHAQPPFPLCLPCLKSYLVLTRP
jgi:hypothetical protein